MDSRRVALQHIEEIGIAAEIQLVGSFQLDAAIAEEPGQNAVHDGGADLRLDIIADHRQAAFDEAILPVFLAGDEDRDAVDQTAAGFENLFDIPLGGFLGADRADS